MENPIEKRNVRKITTNLSGLTVSHAYTPSTVASSTFFVANVTISNTTGSTLNDLKYVRVMDWDVPPTEFSEFVTIKGTATTSLLDDSHDNGFVSANPLANSDGAGGTNNVDFEDSGPADHGAYFRFKFGDLATDASRTFQIFYGAAANESDALAAIAAEGIELICMDNRYSPKIAQRNADIFGCLSANEQRQLETFFDRLIAHCRPEGGGD